MNFLRQYSIMAGVPGREGFEITSVGVNRPLHVNFSLEKTDTQSSNTGRLQISNLNEEHKAVLSEAGCVVEIKAGYSDTLGTVFLGGAANPSEVLNGADRALELELIDGLSSYDSLCTLSMNGVVNASAIIPVLQEQMGIESVIMTEKAAVMLDSAKYANGYCFVGKSRAALQALVSKAGLAYTFQQGVLQIYFPGEAITAQAYVISYDTGLISVPKKITITESSLSSGGGAKVSSLIPDGSGNGTQGYEVEYLINGAIGINDLVQVESKELNGIFRVKKQSFSGDNYSGDWICKAQIVEVAL